MIFFGRSDTNLRGIILNKYNLILNSVMGVFEGKTILELCERESGEANWGQTSSKQFCLLTILQLVAIYKNGLQFITSSGFQFSARRAWLWRFAIMKTNVFHEVLIFWITAAYYSQKNISSRRYTWPCCSSKTGLLRSIEWPSRGGRQSSSS